MKTPAKLSNDYSEGMSLTKAEMAMVIEWERQNTQEAINKYNKLVDVMIEQCLRWMAVHNENTKARS